MKVGLRTVIGETETLPGLQTDGTETLPPPRPLPLPRTDQKERQGEWQGGRKACLGWLPPGDRDTTDQGADCVLVA